MAPINLRYLLLSGLSIAFLFLQTGFAVLAQKTLTRKAAEKLCQKELTLQQKNFRAQAEKNWSDMNVVNESLIMNFGYKIFGEKPSGGRSLYISLHGGGGAPPEVNDEQWHNQMVLYAPKEGVYVAPRAPTNTWMLWHEQHIDDMLDELIKTAIVTEGVNPNKVYVMGYSAGGDGTFQLAPRMADRWAAASMMAGHPGDAEVLNLRNLPFAIFVGGQDTDYNRNGLVLQWGKKLDSLQKADSTGFVHSTHVYPEYGHWMERKDTIALPWMASFTRNPLPDKVVWIQDDRLHTRFYWLGVPLGEAKAGKALIAEVDKQTIQLIRNDYDSCYIYLNDAMVDLDKTVIVINGGKTIFKGRVQRSASVIRETASKLDPTAVFSARLIISDTLVL